MLSPRPSSLAVASLAIAACGLAPAPAPPSPFPGDGVAGFGEASPIELCLGTARVVSPDEATGAGALCLAAGASARPCDADAQCTGTERCICGRCIVQACNGGASCGDGQVCAGQRCTAVCTLDTDCDPGETCNGGGCAHACNGDADCHYGERCDPLEQVCAAELCSDTLPCASGDTCEAESTTGALHEPEIATVGDTTIAFVEIRDMDSGAPPAIYRADVDTPTHWTADPAPVLTGPTGQAAGAPSALVTGNQIDLYFSLGDGQAIGHAVSTDGGRTFGPMDTELLTPASPWENGWVGSPAVVRFQGQALLFYEGGPRAGIGLAHFGAAGVDRFASNPVLSPAGVTDPIFWRDVTEVGSPYALVAGNALRLYFTGRGVEGSDAVTGTTAHPADPNDSIGLAASLDGTIFSLYPTGPVLARVSLLTDYLGEREAAVHLLPGGGAGITFVATDTTGTIESGLAQATE